jgi:hypothetical protein
MEFDGGIANGLARVRRATYLCPEACRRLPMLMLALRFEVEEPTVDHLPPRLR